MPQKTLGVICALFIALVSDGTRASAETDADVLSWLPQPAPGEDLLVVRRNAVMNKMAEVTNNRVTIVKFDDDFETKCPTLTSLLSSAGNRLELVTPIFSFSTPPKRLSIWRGAGRRGPSRTLSLKILHVDMC